jgi:CHAD domain-containing protein
VTGDIEKFFQKEVKSYHKNFRKLKRRFNPDTVHGLRLSVKRTRSLLQFLNCISPELFGSTSSKKPFKKLFNLAGDIRDIQIQRALVRRTAREKKLNIRPYSSYLKLLEKRAVKIFTNKLIHTNEHVSMERQHEIESLIRNLEDIDKIRIRTIHLLNEMIREIESHIANLEDENSIHEIRIILKQMLYIFSFTRKLIRKELFLKLTFKKIKRIESCFGDWHDRLNALIFLERYLKEESPIDSKPYVTLKLAFADQKEQLATQIKLALHKELHFYYVLEI